MTLEEARAVRLLSDRISSLLAIVAALARARDRETKATERADQADEECRRLEHVISGEAERMRAFAERLARPVKRAAYSAAARQALESIAKVAQPIPFVALIARRGVDVVAWGAEVHCASPRRDGPLLIVDVNSASDEQRARFEAEDSELLRLADGGTLVVIGLSALPLAAHEKFASALSRRAAHVPRSNLLPPGVVLISPLPLREAVSRGTLSSNLARWFEGAEVPLPGLVERAEDLRAIALDLLAKKSVEFARSPAGLEPSALRLLLEHAWPENELELSLVLGRALAVSSGPAVTASDLERSGFVAVEPNLETDEPRPVSRRRASFRPR
jgi:DNA-binding NtrC family response regulator